MARATSPAEAHSLAIFGAVATAAGLYLVVLALRFASRPERPAFRRFFLMTLLYLPVVLTALAIDWN